MYITKEMTRSEANNFELITHYADEEHEVNWSLEGEVVNWMEFILKKYSKITETNL